MIYNRRFYAKFLLTSVSLLLIGTMALISYTLAFDSTSVASALVSTQHDEEVFPPEISAIFDNPLKFLGEGNQAYAFESSDGRHVVKFFKRSPIEGNHWQAYLPNIEIVNQWRENQNTRSARKFKRLFNAYDIAYRLDRDYCGLICVHLYQTDHLQKTALVSNGFGMQHSIDLDKVAFVIQKRATPLRQHLKELLDNGKINEAVKALQKVIAMYIDEYERGIYDHDHNLMHNVGFVEGEPIRIDVGKLVYDVTYQSPEVYKIDLDKIIHQRISKWLRRYAKENHDEIMGAIQ